MPSEMISFCGLIYSIVGPYDVNKFVEKLYVLEFLADISNLLILQGFRQECLRGGSKRGGGLGVLPRRKKPEFLNFGA